MQLAIDSASDDPGIALAVDGVAALTLTWHTQQNHSVELLPNIERLLDEAGRSRADIDAIGVNIGPGGYAALRVGVSIAKALAHALAVPIAGVGRLELDAWSVSGEAAARRIVAVHRAGRGEVAWAAYRREDDGWQEQTPPHIDKTPELYTALGEGDAVTGDIDDALAEAIARAGALTLSPRDHRVIALAALAQRRIAGVRGDAATALVPLYLRAPAIGSQPPAG